MICPTGFIRDHELSEGEAQAFMHPVREYEAVHNFLAVSHFRYTMKRIKLLITSDRGAKIIKAKKLLNKIFHRELVSKWE